MEEQIKALIESIKKEIEETDFAVECAKDALKNATEYGKTLKKKLIKAEALLKGDN